MAHKALILALGTIVAISPASAQPDFGPIESDGAVAATPAPPGTPSTKYCLRVELTGNVVDPIQCWTREQWVDQGVDVDKEWAEDGVAIKA